MAFWNVLELAYMHKIYPENFLFLLFVILQLFNSEVSIF